MEEDIVKGKLRNKNASYQSPEIGKGDILSFLKEYFSIEGDVARRIEEESMGSFVWAELYVEFYKKRRNRW